MVAVASWPPPGDDRASETPPPCDSRPLRASRPHAIPRPRSLSRHAHNPTPGPQGVTGDMSRVMLVHQPTDGGVGRHVKDIAEGLAERGHEVVLCGPTLPAGIATSLPRVRHVHLDLGRSIAPRSDLLALRSLIRIVRAVKPDIVHAHSSKAGALSRLA